MRWVMVNVLPEPVTPSSTWSCSCRAMPSTSAAIACGWSPAGWNSDEMANRRPTSASGRSALRTGIVVTIVPIGAAGQGRFLFGRHPLADGYTRSALALPDEIVALGEVIRRGIGECRDRRLRAFVHRLPLPWPDTPHRHAADVR